MSTSWVAGSVRARAMARRRLGAGAARSLADMPSLDDAVDVLAASPYGHDVRPGQSLEEVQHAVAATVLWHLRVLAGWVPHGDARILRVLAGGFEVANTDEHVRVLSDGADTKPFQLGGLTTAWPWVSTATSLAAVRDALGQSAWGDPGGDTPAVFHLGMRVSWADRVASQIPGIHPWAAGAVALLMAREVLVAGHRPTEAIARMAGSMLGSRWLDARSIPALAAAVPTSARWALAGVEDPDDLWRAEVGWWARVERDGFKLLRQPVASPDSVVGAAAVMAADAWRVRAALEVAARGGSKDARALEAFDAVA
ncbi:MAG: hypothetical protein R2720_01780 [Candidatus Nanopelagicales bacterium]